MSKCHIVGNHTPWLIYIGSRFSHTLLKFKLKAFTGASPELSSTDQVSVYLVASEAFEEDVICTSFLSAKQGGRTKAYENVFTSSNIVHMPAFWVWDSDLGSKSKRNLFHPIDLD